MKNFEYARHLVMSPLIAIGGNHVYRSSEAYSALLQTAVNAYVSPGFALTHRCAGFCPSIFGFMLIDTTCCPGRNTAS